MITLSFLPTSYICFRCLIVLSQPALSRITLLRNDSIVLSPMILLSSGLDGASSSLVCSPYLPIRKASALSLLPLSIPKDCLISRPVIHKVFSFNTALDPPFSTITIFLKNIINKTKGDRMPGINRDLQLQLAVI